MKNRQVSILIATYNAEQFIKKTIQSCLNQSYDKFEILVLDNNSMDTTVEVVRGFNDDRIKLFESSENLGPYGGLNFLLDKADGEYIAIQDHDDIWLSEKIKKQVKFLEKNNNFIACGTNVFQYYESNKVLILMRKPKVTNYVNHTSLMFRNGGFRYQTKYLLADEYFEKKILGKEGMIACLPGSLAIHRIKNDGTNLSSSRFKFSIKNIREFFEINSLSFQSMNYLFYLLIGKFAPDWFMWWVKRKITQRNSLWIKLKDFKSKYPNVEL